MSSHYILSPRLDAAASARGQNGLHSDEERDDRGDDFLLRPQFTLIFNGLKMGEIFKSDT